MHSSVNERWFGYESWNVILQLQSLSTLSSLELAKEELQEIQVRLCWESHIKCDMV